MPAYHAMPGRSVEMYGRLHLPARLVPRHRDVASASEPPGANELPRRSVTMSATVCFKHVVFSATVPSVCCGVP